MTNIDDIFSMLLLFVVIVIATGSYATVRFIQRRRNREKAEIKRQELVKKATHHVKPSDPNESSADYASAPGVYHPTDSGEKAGETATFKPILTPDDARAQEIPEIRSVPKPILPSTDEEMLHNKNELLYGRNISKGDLMGSISPYVPPLKKDSDTPSGRKRRQRGIDRERHFRPPGNLTAAERQFNKLRPLDDERTETKHGSGHTPVTGDHAPDSNTRSNNSSDRDGD